MEFLQSLGIGDALEDQTKEVSGGDRRVVPDGMTYGRLIEYVELGPQPQRPYMGKSKPDCEEVRITFELLTPRNKYTNFEGVEVYDTITWRGPKRHTQKANFNKLFKAMQRGRAEVTHMLHMLGEAFQLEVFHNVSEKDGKQSVWVNLFSSDSACNIKAPVIVDPMTGETTSPTIPAHTKPFRVFLWARPTKECWESLFIDGEYEIKEGDTTVTKSRNILQNALLASPAFAGSDLEVLLGMQGAPEGFPSVPSEDIDADDIFKSEVPF